MRSPNYGYHWARLYGKWTRRFYSVLLPLIVRRRLHPPRQIELDVFAYSSEEALPEQVASIRSFLRHAGRPRVFVVVSDGSHSERSIGLLRQIDRCVSVECPAITVPYPDDRLSHYLATHPTGKQLRLIMSLPRHGPALYIDSDVLFFEEAGDLLDRLREKEVPAFYLTDCQFAGDERILHDAAEKGNPVNTGVLLILHPLDWSLGLARFAEMEGEPSFFTNQTITHLVMHDNRARSFDPAKYVLQLDDQFVFPDRYADASLALRHYVNPVRHKFWTSLNQ